MCFVDRANIGNARLAGLEADLGLIGYDYNILLTCFYIVRIVPLTSSHNPNRTDQLTFNSRTSFLNFL
jgi:hypothetical protein